MFPSIDLHCNSRSLRNIKYLRYLILLLLLVERDGFGLYDGAKPEGEGSLHGGLKTK